MYWFDFFSVSFSLLATYTELPEELCQLADMQKLRREKAIEDYWMNEDGLSIKSAMEFNREKKSTEG